MQFRLCSLRLAAALLLLSLGACASGTAPTTTAPPVERERIAELAQAIGALSADIDPREARRAASLAFNYSRYLARQYEVTDSALMHNLKVNLGLKPRGLCVHWTRDLLARLKKERFRSLDLHWGIANYERAFRIEHSTAIVTARGEPMQRGIVLDPWRHGGELFWAPTLADPEYQWKPQAEILALKKQIEIENDERSSAR